MALFQIKLRGDLPSYKFSIELDSEVFVFQFNWNTRDSRWFFDILDQNEAAILMGQPVFVSWDVLGRFKNEKLPKGKIAFYDTRGREEDPGRTDLGDRVQMFYNEAL